MVSAQLNSALYHRHLALSAVDIRCYGAGFTYAAGCCVVISVKRCCGYSIETYPLEMFTKNQICLPHSFAATSREFKTELMNDYKNDARVAAH